MTTDAAAEKIGVRQPCRARLAAAHSHAVSDAVEPARAVRLKPPADGAVEGR